MVIVDLRECGVLPNTEQDYTFKIYNILKNLDNNESVTVSFDEGVYHFYPEFALEKMLHISNHEDGLRRIAFPLINKENLKIQGNNTKFIFHLDIIPFYIHDCKNIEITGITIDYAISGYAEADILSAKTGELILQIDKDKYPHEINNNQLLFKAEGVVNPIYAMLEIDPKTWAPTYNMGDDWVNRYPYVKYEDLGHNKVRMFGENPSSVGFRPDHTVGNKLILRSHDRTHPGFYLTSSENVCLNNIDMYQCLGMGVIAQHSKNITLDNFNLKLDENNKRVFTAVADATHFVYCYGDIILNNCLFENQLDDPINVHGIYGRIKTVISSTEFIFELVERQQKGVLLGKVGDRLSLVNNETLLSYGVSNIKEIDMLNEDFTHIKLKKPVEGIEIGHVIEVLEYVPNITITNCTFRNNRARGPLLTSAGKVVLKNNVFSIPGAAILIEGDANYWFESGATKDILIENNIFQDCAYVNAWGSAPIQVTPRTSKVEEGVRYHKSLVINNNEFRCFDDRLIFAESIENIIFTNNKIRKTTAYKPLGNEKYVLKDVINFEEYGNIEE